MVHKTDVGYCPECDAKVSVKSAKLGQIVVCRVCDTRLEVIDTNPLELDWAFEDDLEDDDFDFDYGDEELASEEEN